MESQHCRRCRRRTEWRIAICEKVCRPSFRICGGGWNRFRLRCGLRIEVITICGLSDIVGGGDSDLPKTSLGNAVKEMQADDSLSPENSGFGFNYANGDYDLHYASGSGNENAFRFSGGLRHDDSQSSYIGEGSSPFSAENASDTGGYVKWTTKNYGGISAFGEYGRTQIKADYDSASFISQIKNARAEEWTAGFQYRDLFLHNDSLQFSARQESRISGGEMVLHYPVSGRRFTQSIHRRIRADNPHRNRKNSHKTKTANNLHSGLFTKNRKQQMVSSSRMERGNKRKRSFFRHRIRPTLKPKSPQKTFNNPTQKQFQMKKSYDKKLRQTEN